ncbi:MAG TPA: glycine betaine ABC transporter substrate-binding protein [Sporosarcina sp.]|nr:glycine betaine ABC transporter substrate-binding protein [Sporosarcina sp.]
MKIWKRFIGIGAATCLALGLGACGSSSASQNDGEQTVGESVDYKIIGLDPGSGHMEASEKVMVEYGLEEGQWELIYGNGAAMTAALKRAYDKEEPIVVAGWNPHWKFLTYDLKFLDDPKLLYGDEEKIHTYARLGLKEDKPEAYEILTRFNWDADDMGDIMMDIEAGVDPEEAAQKWVKANEDKVAEWTDGVDSVDGETLTFVLAPWDSEIASHHMLKVVFEAQGYDVTLSTVEPGPLFSALASGKVDASVAVWLPYTHKTYIEKYDGKFEGLGHNMEGVRQGLVVPTYMEDVNSIEDLRD